MDSDSPLEHLLGGASEAWLNLAKYLPESPDLLIGMMAVVDFAEACGNAVEEGLGEEDKQGLAASMGVTLALAVISEWLGAVAPIVDKPWKGRVGNE